MRDTVRSLKLCVSFPHQIWYKRLKGHTKTSSNIHKHKRQSRSHRNSDLQARKGLLQAASPSSSMTGTAEFHLPVCALSPQFCFHSHIYFRKLPYFGLNILSYPWADKQGLAHRVQLGAGQPAPSPALGTGQGWPGIWGTGD